MKKTRFETLSIHGGQSPDPTTLACGVPLHRTTSYVFRDADHAADLFALKEPGYIYTRMGNPTQDALEKRVALLEGGCASLALASGTSAIFYSLINLAGQGDDIVAASNLYGGTHTLMDAILPQFGITTRLVPPNDLDAFDAAIGPRTRAMFVEAIGNPTLETADIAALADLAHSRGLPLLVDATFVTPYLLRPIEHGADIVIHSLTKWMGGHGTAIGGIVTDAGRFNFDSGRFPLYTEPDSGYHGLRWGRDLEPGMPPFLTRMRLVPLRNLGACISPDNAWMFLQGLETLPLRMERHSQNAQAVAMYLASHPKAAWVRYPGLPPEASAPDGEAASRLLARRYLPRGCGGMVVFGLRSDDPVAAGRRFVERLSLFSHLANVGDARSLVLHPASTTHSQLSEGQRAEAGLAPELIRLSIGIEHIEDILEDLGAALAAV